MKNNQLKKLKVYMIQEGTDPKELQTIICVNCGKRLRESDNVYWDYEYGYAFCTLRHAKEGADNELAELQARRFAL